jgi:hypothetical protein
LVGSFGGTPAASKIRGLAGNSLPSTITLHFGIWRFQRKFLAAAVMSFLVRAETLELGM